MLSHLRPAASCWRCSPLLTGLAYPLAITGLAQVALPSAANGSLIRGSIGIVGSQLIGQAFTSDRLLPRPRPSAAGEKGYDAAASSGSNLGPLSKKLIGIVSRADVGALRKAAGLATPVPADAVTTSASGLDPHISPAFAALQVARIAAARGSAGRRRSRARRQAHERPRPRHHRRAARQCPAPQPRA